MALEAGFYYTLLTFFWLVMLERIRTELTAKKTKAIKTWKAIFALSVGILVTAWTVFLAYYYLKDPSYSIKELFPAFYYGMNLAAFLLVGFFIFYLGSSIAFFFRNFSKKPARHIQFLALTICTLVIQILMIVFGLYNYFDSYSSCFTVFMLANNMYVWTLQTIYLPTKDDCYPMGAYSKKLTLKALNEQ